MKKLLRMALFATLPLAAMMMFSSYSSGSENNPCPPPGNDYEYSVLVPVPDDCTSFYSCSYGIPILMDCPDGLIFNDELDTCEVGDVDTCIIAKGEVTCYTNKTHTGRGADIFIECGTCFRYIGFVPKVPTKSGKCPRPK